MPNTALASQFSFSPDSKWLLAVRAGSLLKLNVQGGPEEKIADSLAFGTWGDNDIIVAERRGTIVRMSAAGGPQTILAKPDSAKGINAYGRPWILPGSQAALVEIRRAQSVDSTQIGVVRLDNGEVTSLGITGVNPRYAASGHLLIGNLAGKVTAVAFDLKKLELRGQQLTVLEDVHVKSGGAMELGVSSNGTLAYIDGASSITTDLLMVSRDGIKVEKVPLPAGSYHTPRISPDGKRLALTLTDAAASGSSDVYVYDISSGVRSRLSSDGQSSRPEWTPDSKRVVWRSGTVAPRLLMQPWDKSAPQETFIAADSEDRRKSPDGVTFSAATRSFAFVTAGQRGNTDIGMSTFDSTSTSTMLVATNLPEFEPRLSPDGKWLAYVAFEGDRSEVYVRPFSGSGGRIQVSVNGGAAPMWSSHSNDLYYYQSGYFRMLSARVGGAAVPEILSRDTLGTFSTAPSAYQNWSNYDVFGKGERFLMTGGGDRSTTTRVVVVTGWLSELRERMAQSKLK